MNQVQKVLKKIDLHKGMSINRAIVSTRDYLERQADPTKVANSIVAQLEIPGSYIQQPSKASFYALAAIEQALLQDIFDPVATAKMIEMKFVKTHKKMPYCFNDGHSTDEHIKAGRKGAKRAIATQIYFENRDKTDKEIISLIAEELEVSAQNAYTYLYLVKKSIP